ncbi:unnamed protein product [Peniophora sp. CBMAI 1063]|nr:unnamed protein product [Peniophora sp. CBMAI 1063]
MFSRIPRRFSASIAVLGIVACVGLWSGRLPLSRTKACAEVISELLELQWKGEIRPHKYVSSIPGLVHFAGTLEGALNERKYGQPAKGMVDPDVQDVHYLRDQLDNLDESLTLVRSRALYTHNILLRQLQKYKAAVDLSMLPLWLGPPTPSTLRSLFDDEVHPYLLALQEAIAVNRGLSSVLDRIQERSPEVFPLARNITAGTRLVSSYDAKQSRSGDIAVSLLSLDAWWSACLALHDELLPFFDAHLRAVSELHHKYSVGKIPSCPTSPWFSTSLYQGMDKILRLLEDVLPASFDATERETIHMEAKGVIEAEIWVSLVCPSD